MSAVVVNLVSRADPRAGIWRRRRRVGTSISRFYMAAVFPRPRQADDAGLPPRAEGTRGRRERQSTAGLGTGIANIAEWGSPNLTFILGDDRHAGHRPGQGRHGLRPRRAGHGCRLEAPCRHGHGHERPAPPSASAAARGAGREGSEPPRRRRLIIGGVIIAIAIILLREPIAARMLTRGRKPLQRAFSRPMAQRRARRHRLRHRLRWPAGRRLHGDAGAGRGVDTDIHLRRQRRVFVMLPLCCRLAIPQGMGIWGVVVAILRLPLRLPASPRSSRWRSSPRDRAPEFQRESAGRQCCCPFQPTPAHPRLPGWTPPSVQRG